MKKDFPKLSAEHLKYIRRYSFDDLSNSFDESEVR